MSKNDTPQTPKVTPIPEGTQKTAEKIVAEATKKAEAPKKITATAKPSEAKAAAKPAPKKAAAKKTTVKKATVKNPMEKRVPPKAGAKKSDKVVNISQSAVRDMFTTTAEEAKKTKETVMALGMDGAQHFSKGADISAKVFNESVTIGQENVEACIEASNIAADHANKISESVVSYANDAISDNVDMSKELFSCRTASDVFELQNRFFQSNVERFFSESAKVSEMMFELTTKASEPFGDRVAEVTDRLNKVIK